MDSQVSVFRKHQDSFDENDKEILDEKHQKHKAHLSNTNSVSS